MSRADETKANNANAAEVEPARIFLKLGMETVDEYIRWAHVSVNQPVLRGENLPGFEEYVATKKVTPLLEKIEWSSYQNAQYWGQSRCCPCCKGIHPDDEKDGWIKSAVGHKENCELGALIKMLTESPSQKTRPTV